MVNRSSISVTAVYIYIYIFSLSYWGDNWKEFPCHISVRVSGSNVELYKVWRLLSFFCLIVCNCFSLCAVPVAALNNLYVSLGYPPLRGWILVGGDPCEEGWQGVECIYSNISGL